MSNLYRLAFHALTHIGRPFGGVRPRRVYRWLALRGWSATSPGAQEFRWYRDRWGHRFHLHPRYLIDRSIIAFGGYDLPLLGFLEARLRPGMVCCDVGANLGQVTVHMAGLVRPGGRVHAFEPLPHVRERLERHVAANAVGDVVEIHPFALARENGTVRFRYAEGGAENQGMGSLVAADPALALSCEVRTLRLDDFVEQRGIERLDWMKIDIQGAEPLLLAGGRRTLERFSPELLVEFAPQDLRAAGFSSRDLARLLDELGYRLHAIRGRRLGPGLGPDVAEDHAAENVYGTRRPAASP